jgi:hypothetical protein
MKRASELLTNKEWKESLLEDLETYKERYEQKEEEDVGHTIAYLKYKLEVKE